MKQTKENRLRFAPTNVMFPLTESDPDLDVLSSPIVMETIELCRN